MKRAPLFLVLALAGCRFNPALEYPPCQTPSDCPSPCECQSGHCLPPAGAGLGPEACVSMPSGCQSDSECMTFCACKDNTCQPRETEAFSAAECDPGRIAPGDPLGSLGLLGVDWGALPDRNLIVNSAGDDPAPSAQGLTLRAALAQAVQLSRESDLPVRIAFDPAVFSNGNAPYIHLAGPLSLGGRNIFLDGRGTQARMKPASDSIDTPLRVSCRTCLIADLSAFFFNGYAMEIVGAEDLYLFGIEIHNCGESLSGNGGGLFIGGGSRRVTVGDGQGHPALGEPHPCWFHDNFGAGIVIGDVDSPPEDVVLIGVKSTGNIDLQQRGLGAGISLRARSKNVFIGPYPGLDRKIQVANEFCQNGDAGIILSGPVDRTLVRGNLLCDQPVAIALQNLQGEVKFIHNTVIDPQTAVASCRGIPDRGRAFFWASNDIFYSSTPAMAFWALDGQSPCAGLDLFVDYALLYNVACEPQTESTLCAWVPRATIRTQDPVFIGSESPYPTDGAAANGADPNLEYEGLKLDTNGSAPGRYNGNGPAFGALEEP